MEISKPPLINYFLTLFWEDLIGLFYPRLCLACGTPLPQVEPYFCLECQLLLPRTDHHLYAQNELLDKFKGRIDLQSAAALYYFTPHGRAQRLIHQIKYKGKWKVAIEIGKMFGAHLKTSPEFQTVDVVVPVPMYFKKQRARGFNQAQCFAHGLSDSLKVPLDDRSLKKIKPTTSQTRKNRIERLKNQEEVFIFSPSRPFSPTHILLVDDVITTGATMEACAQTILDVVPNIKISIAAIAAVKPK